MRGGWWIIEWLALQSLPGAAIGLLAGAGGVGVTGHSVSFIGCAIAQRLPECNGWGFERVCHALPHQEASSHHRRHRWGSRASVAAPMGGPVGLTTWGIKEIRETCKVRCKRRPITFIPHVKQIELIFLGPLSK